MVTSGEGPKLARRGRNSLSALLRLLSSTGGCRLPGLLTSSAGAVLRKALKAPEDWPLLTMGEFTPENFCRWSACGLS